MQLLLQIPVTGSFPRAAVFMASNPPAVGKRISAPENERLGRPYRRSDRALRQGVGAWLANVVQMAMKG